ncbi:hypothetical protein [Lysinibacillus agricola]|uniref:hypothetical protein n=1 Tax=Lysinibacillus agricola TaxID=2590012 RepID=UPI003C1C7693
MKSILVKGNVIFSGFVALFIAWFFAEGAIGDAPSLTPEFFLILPIWAIGVLLMWRFVFKNKLENTSYFKILLSNTLLWLTIPIGLKFAFQFI